MHKIGVSSYKNALINVSFFSILQPNHFTENHAREVLKHHVSTIFSDSNDFSGLYKSHKWRDGLLL